MEDACGEVDVGALGGWIRHSRRYFPCCLARENIACDVDEVLFSQTKIESRMQPNVFLTVCTYFCLFVFIVLKE